MELVGVVVSILMTLMILSNSSAVKAWIELTLGMHVGRRIRRLCVKAQACILYGLAVAMH